ncbi:MAG: transporter substrate-binding domain-containing protein [Eubacteriales bacterium]|nr:transporter substrate-binding domain-containing protein [Eubacteriales bacterium]
MLRRMFAIALMLVMMMTLAACGQKAAPSGVEDGVLTVGMECAYAPYNWYQNDDANGAVPISNVPGAFANGYDVMMAKKLCEANGWELEVKKMDWDALVPAVMNGEIDCAIAGQSMTAQRDEQVDFAGPYLYASIVCLTRQDSPLAAATGKSQLAGKCTSQSGTIWYDACLPQIPGAEIQPAQDTAPAMLMALASGNVDFVCTDIPTAQGALIVFPELTILNFSGTDDDFEVSQEEVNIGISVRDGNTELKEAMDKVLSTMTADDFNALMAEAVLVQPIE